MSVIQSGCENNLVSEEKLSGQPFENDCDELFCTADINLHDCDVSVNVSCISSVLDNNDVSDDSNVFNHNHSMSDECFNSSADTFLENVCDEKTVCNSLTDNDINQISVFSDLHNFRNKFARQIVLGHLNINSLRNKFLEI